MHLLPTGAEEEQQHNDMGKQAGKDIDMDNQVTMTYKAMKDKVFKKAGWKIDKHVREPVPTAAELAERFFLLLLQFQALMLRTSIGVGWLAAPSGGI